MKAEKLKAYLEIMCITAKRKVERYSLYTSRADLGATYCAS